MSKQLPTIRIQPDSQSSLPRRQSLDGRFTIIDEQSKDSDSFDETSSDNESNNDQIFFSKSGYISKCSSPNLPHLNYSTSQPSRMSALNANASRFRVVPVEAQYQRKRWIVWDWFDSGTQQNQNAMGGTIIRGSQSNPHTPNPVNSTKPIFHLTPPTKRSVQKSNSMRAPLATPDPPMSTTSLAFNFSDDSDRENSFPFEKNQITVRQTGRQPESEEPRTTNITDLRDELQSSRLSPTPSGILPSLMMPSGRISPSEMLNQYGLERSLSATSYSTPKSVTTTSQLKANSLSPDRATTHPYLNDGSTGVVSAVNHAPHSASNLHAHVHGSSIVAIDSKIEQAMDLVKTHLMFAVREEVDSLRSRIMELETTVVHLEAENSILREHVPNEILQSLSIQPASTNHGATAMT
ncbi:hypothetical protein M3Y97_00228900 [Aphelenchoides bicaudatus]|nr:hypothetical protein M3Y97_00228900 [Aphelenchoides bicaudatus]